MGTFKTQKIYGKVEASYGAGVAGDFTGATGYRIHNAADGPADLSNVIQQLSPVNFTIGSMEEITPAAESTIEDITATLNVVFPGATLTGDNVTADVFDIFFSSICSDSTFAAASDACDAGCAADTIIVAGAAVFVAGQLIMVGGEVRKIATWTLGTKTITLTLPLTSVPSAGVKIYNVMKHNTAGDATSVSMGFEHAEANADYLLNGVFAEGIKLSTINNQVVAQLELSLRAQTASVGSGLETANTTQEIENDAVSCAAGGRVQLLRADGTSLLTLCVREAECVLGTKNIPVACFTAINGIGGFERAPEDAQGSLRVVAWESDGATRELIKAVIGNTSEIVVQLGTVRGKVVGVYYPQAALAEKEPRFVDSDGVIGIEAMFRTSAGWLFRA